MAAIAQIEAWCREMGIDCEFRRVPAYMYSESTEGMEALRQESEHARRLGLEVAMVDTIGLPFAHGGLRIENQARFHALRYVQGLAKALHAGGVAIHEHSPAQPPRDGEPCTVDTPEGRVTAVDVLLCTHTCYMGITEIDTLVAPYQSYVMTGTGYSGTGRFMSFPPCAPTPVAMCSGISSRARGTAHATAAGIRPWGSACTARRRATFSRRHSTIFRSRFVDGGRAIVRHGTQQRVRVAAEPPVDTGPSSRTPHSRLVASPVFPPYSLGPTRSRIANVRRLRQRTTRSSVCPFAFAAGY